MTDETADPKPQPLPSVTKSDESANSYESANSDESANSHGTNQRDQTNRNDGTDGRNRGFNTADHATVAFCQQCGRGLNVNSVRAVGSGIFCEPCASRYGAACGGSVPPPGTGTVPGSVSGSTAPGGYTRVHAPAVDSAAARTPSASGEPNPVLAGFLGLIPGVGAMYNGQYAKGAVHLLIFVVLTSVADNLNWVLWWLVWGWIFYQAFEAYHTAQAKRDGMPLPDPFGWNDLGDRLGLSRTSPPMTAPPRYSSRPAPGGPGGPGDPGDLGGPAGPGGPAQASGAVGSVPYTATPAPPFPVAAAQTAASPQTAAATASETAFVPMPSSTDSPTHSPVTSSVGDPFTDRTSGPIPPPYAYSPPSSPYPSSPDSPYVPNASEIPYGAPFEPQYNRTYTGAPLPSPANLPPGAQRLPFGAAWLIGLGALFLLANLAPGWRLEARWLVPALLALVALWIGSRRIETTLRTRDKDSLGTSIPALAEGLVGAALLLTVAILLALQNAYVIPLRHSWPAVLIVWGSLLLIGRARPAPSSSDFDTAPQAPKP